MRQNHQEFGDVLVWAEDRDLDLFVNTVSSPPQFSLNHAPDAELSQIQRQFRAQSERIRPMLDRNLKVWDRQIAALDGLISERQKARVLSLPKRRATRANDRADLDEMVVVTTDGDQIVRSVVGPGLREASLETLVGRSLADLVPHLSRLFGKVAESMLLPRSDGVEDRMVVFSDGLRRTELRGTLTSGDSPDQRWELVVWARSPAPGPSPGGPSPE